MTKSSEILRILKNLRRIISESALKNSLTHKAWNVMTKWSKSPDFRILSYTIHTGASQRQNSWKVYFSKNLHMEKSNKVKKSRIEKSEKAKNRKIEKSKKVKCQNMKKITNWKIEKSQQVEKSKKSKSCQLKEWMVKNRKSWKIEEILAQCVKKHRLFS